MDRVPIAGLNNACFEGNILTLPLPGSFFINEEGDWNEGLRELSLEGTETCNGIGTTGKREGGGGPPTALEVPNCEGITEGGGLGTTCDDAECLGNGGKRLPKAVPPSSSLNFGCGNDEEDADEVSTGGELVSDNSFVDEEDSNSICFCFSNCSE